MPLVNVTELQRIINTRWEVDGENEKIKDTLEISNIYPRWIGFANLSYAPNDASELKHINTIFNLGDSDLEIEMNVAQGFPNISLTPYDIIMPQSFAEFFDWSEE